MFFKKAKPLMQKNSMQTTEDARRDIHDAIARHGLSSRAAAALLEGMAQTYRIYALNSAPSLTTPQVFPAPRPSKPEIALSAVARLIAGKTA